MVLGFDTDLMKKFEIVALATLLLFLFSCVRDGYEPAVETTSVPQVLHATLENEFDPERDETKVYMNEDRHLRWDKDDRVAYYSQSTKSEYRFSGETGDAGGDFSFVSNVSSSYSYYNVAVFPYSAAVGIQSNNKVTVTLPGRQVFRSGSFGSGSVIMMSTQDIWNGEMYFKSVDGYLCFRLYGNPGAYIESLTLTGNDGEKLAGVATITANPKIDPSLNWGSSATESITLVCDPPVYLGNSSADCTEFWMAVPPTVFTKGFTLTVNGSGGKMTQKLTSGFTVKRNYMYRMAAFEVPQSSISYSIRSREEMTLKEKVGQLMMIQDNTLLGNYTQSISDDLRNKFADYPCGGFILKAENIEKSSSAAATLKQFTADLHNLADYPILSIDEEGGNVARIGNNSYFGEINATNNSRQAATVGNTGNPANAYASGHYIGTYLREFGLDVNLAPVADVNSNPDNPVINIRSFGSDPSLVGEMVVQYLHGLQDADVEGCLKHFPGHGDTGTDSHLGYAEVTKTWAQMLTCEIVPFRRGINGGAKMIMTAHITLPNVMPSNALVPSTLSYLILHDKLRVELGFNGVIITDAMGMGAITKHYSKSEAAIQAILAGADILLGPANTYNEYKAVFNAIITAVNTGRIPEARINESVDRILAFKRDLLTQRGELK